MSAAGAALPQTAAKQTTPGPLPVGCVCQATFHSGGTQDTAVYEYDTLEPGHSLCGPALLISSIATIVVEPGCTAHITAAGDVRIDIVAAVKEQADDEQAATCDPIQLAIFSHR